jgi:hypothetical protein
MSSLAHWDPGNDAQNHHFLASRAMKSPPHPLDKGSNLQVPCSSLPGTKGGVLESCRAANRSLIASHSASLLGRGREEEAFAEGGLAALSWAARREAAVRELLKSPQTSG